MHLMLISAGASLEKEETSLNMNAVNYKDKCTIYLYKLTIIYQLLPKAHFPHRHQREIKLIHI